MKAAVYYGINDLRVINVETPQIKEDEVLLRVKACAICASEVRILKYGSKYVKPPRVLGHELIGEIVEVGKNVTDITPGTTVTVYPNVPCSRCNYCLHGKHNLCENLSGLAYDYDGGFAEFVRIPSSIVKVGGLVPVPPLIEASLTEPLSTVINSVEKLEGRSCSSVAVIGTGPMGLMNIMLLRGNPKINRIIAVDILENRLEYALKFGADYVINASQEDFANRILELTNGRGVDALIVTICDKTTIERAIKVCRPMGLVNLFAGCPAETYVSLDINAIHYGERIITGSYGSTVPQFKVAAKLIESGKLPLKMLITHEFSLDNIIEGFRTVMNKQGLKVVILP